VKGIEIAALEDDTFGPHVLRTLNIEYGLDGDVEIQVARSLVANLGHLSLDSRILPNFYFLSLRSLYLTNVQYDAICPSFCVEQVAGILAAAPNLIHLQLSVRHKIGIVTSEGEFIHMRQTRERHFLQALCLEYAQRRVKPLRLKTLWLGFGCEIDDPGTHNHPHYLWQLMEPACLEGLHLEQVDFCSERPRYRERFTRDMGFQLVTSTTSPPTLGCGVLPALRKLTWPWADSRILGLLNNGDPAFLSQIVLRIDWPHQKDWLTESGAPSWVADGLGPIPHIKLRGLVLHGETMSPEDTETLLDFIPHWGLQCLRIRMSHMVQGVLNPAQYAEFMDWFWAKMEAMTDLRELWLTDGLGSWMGFNECPEWD
jgi:hypothetical protein